MTPLLYSAQTAPYTTVSQLSGGGDVLVLAPHPDDETLGCGGAIAAASAAGCRVQVVVVTDGGQSHPRSQSHPPDVLRRLRATEVNTAVRILTGGRGPDPVLLGYPDSPAPGSDESYAGATERVLSLIPPQATAIWSTWDGDPHPDHGRAAHLARQIALLRPDLALWSYPVWGRFVDDLPAQDLDRLFRLDTTAWQPVKTLALAAHASQMTGLISDDPGGFRMTDMLQQHFLNSPELFFDRTGT